MLKTKITDSDPLKIWGLSGSFDVDYRNGNAYYRSGDWGYTINDWSYMTISERDYMVAYLRQVEEQKRALASIPPMDLGDALGDMLGVEPYKVNDYRANTYEKPPQETSPYRTPIAPYDHPNYGVSLNTGTGSPVVLKPATKTKFDKWQEAREKFIRGEVGIEEVLKYVESDEDGYSRLVDEEIAEERAKNVAVPKHGIDWRRWPLWRWLVAWLHWGNLGRRRNRQDNARTALCERPGATRRSSLDHGGF